MDLTAILAFFVLGLLGIGATLYMLNRAWGDFPSRAGPRDRGPSPLPQSSWPAREAAPAQTADFAHQDEEESAALPAGAPADELIPVTHPLVRRAVEQALERGGSPYATYFLRDGDRIYLAAYRIADPVQRAQISRLFQGLNSGTTAGINFAELIGAIQRLGK